VIPRTFARSFALAAWAAFFGVVWLSGDSDRYLGTRTTWVVPFGAVATGLAAAILLRRRGHGDRPLQSREGVGIAALLLPILLVIAVPHAELGAAAAERRAIDPSAIARIAAARSTTSRISYAQIMADAVHPQPGARPGVRVGLVGFAMQRAGTAPGLFQVTRFQLTCCIADATPLFVTVDPPAGVPPRNAWVSVTGPLARRQGELIVQADSVERIEEPARPYLSQWGEVAVPSTRHGTRLPDPTKTSVPPPAAH
jgi:uncharacterized repeat protein (TIGR03943 family)